eukprot:GHRQ01017343.1.p1 GENE.GHRQ01017343.1~~GHRQ01017343.1.p1  ORF type:complete len:118 (+),score=3.63 GHRQ01017343.1:292-645(+)
MYVDQDVHLVFGVCPGCDQDVHLATGCAILTRMYTWCLVGALAVIKMHTGGCTGCDQAAASTAADADEKGQLTCTVLRVTQRSPLYSQACSARQAGMGLSRCGTIALLWRGSMCRPL